MTREEFTVFTREAIDRAVRVAEEKSGRRLPRELRFQWLGKGEVVDSGIAEAVVSRVFVEPDLIYPCVDIGVAGVDSKNRTLLVASIAGYAPRPFGKNWIGAEGPYIIIVGAQLLNGSIVPDAGVSGAFGFSISGFPGKGSGG